MKRLLIALVACFAVPVYADFEVCWQAPTENTDNSPLTDLAGFRMYVDGALEADIPASQVCRDVARPPGEYAVSMVAYDDADNESAVSNTSTFDDLPPKAPIVISITISISQ